MINVAGRRTPPFTNAAAALAKLNGVTEMPWPKAIVITLTSRHFAGKCGAPISDTSIFGVLSKPSRARNSRCLCPPATIATENPDELVARDLNGDGDADLVVGPGLSQGVKVLIGGPGATFGPPVTYRVRGGVTSLAVGDLNHDGHRDIVTAEFAPDGLSILLGRGDGTFAPYYGYVLNNGAFGVAISDVNLDRNQDLLVGIPANTSRTSASRAVKPNSNPDTSSSKRNVPVLFSQCMASSPVRPVRQRGRRR